MLRISPALALALALFATLAPLPSAADILLVHADGSGPYPTIQAAVDAAVDGDEVHLAAGTYEGEGNREVDLRGKAISVRSQSGDPASVTIHPWIDLNKTARAFILDSGEGPATVLEGMTIAGGWADDLHDTTGIVYCLDSSPVIRHCIFQHNYGSALVNDGGSPLVQHCTFHDNFSFNNSGMGIASFGGAILIEDCTFSENNGEGSGGAAYVNGGTIRRCTFSNNGVYLGGGSLAISGGLVEDCTFGGGGTTYYGGAIAAGNGTLIRRCVFAGNAAERGGAISAGTITVESCLFVHFWGRRWGDAIAVSENSHLELSNSIIAFGAYSSKFDDTTAILLAPGATASISCTDIFGNEGGDWEGDIADFLGQDGNISADPLFCNVPDNYYALHSNSPCAPANSGGCGLIGVFGVACEPTSIEPKSWGEIKGMYR